MFRVSIRFIVVLIIIMTYDFQNFNVFKIFNEFLCTIADSTVLFWSIYIVVYLQEH